MHLCPFPSVWLDFTDKQIFKERLTGALFCGFWQVWECLSVTLCLQDRRTTKTSSHQSFPENVADTSLPPLEWMSLCGGLRLTLTWWPVLSPGCLKNSILILEGQRRCHRSLAVDCSASVFSLEQGFLWFTGSFLFSFRNIFFHCIFDPVFGPFTLPTPVTLR